MFHARNEEMYSACYSRSRRTNDELEFQVQIVLEKIAEQKWLTNAWYPSQVRKDFEELLTLYKEEVVALAFRFIQKNLKHPELKFRVVAAFKVFTGIIKKPRSIFLTRVLVEDILPAFLKPLRNLTDPEGDDVFRELQYSIPNEFWKQVASNPSINPFKLMTTLATLMEVKTDVGYWASRGLSEIATPPRYEDIFAEAAAWAARRARLLSQIATPLNATDDDSPKHLTYLVSPFFEEFIQKLLTVQFRFNCKFMWNDFPPPPTLYTILYLIPTSSDLSDLILRTTITILNHGEASLILRKTITSLGEHTPKSGNLSRLTLVCIALDGILPRLSKTHVPQIEDRVANILVNVLRRPGGDGNVHHSALIALETFVKLLKEDFLKHMNSLWAFVACRLPTDIAADVVTINLTEALQANRVISRYLGHKGLQYYDDIMDTIFDYLREATFPMILKPKMAIVLQDVAEGIGPHFQKYSDKLKLILMEAFKPRNDLDYNESIDHLSRLRFGLCLAYASIIPGLKAHVPNNSGGPGGSITTTTGLSTLQPHLRHLIKLLKKIAIREYMPCQLPPVVIQLIYWILNAYGTQVTPLLDEELIYGLLDKRSRYVDIAVKSLADNAKKMFQENIQRLNKI